MKNGERLEMLPDLINAAAVQSYIMHGVLTLKNTQTCARVGAGRSSISQHAEANCEINPREAGEN